MNKQASDIAMKGADTAKTTPRKLGLKERYNLMTRDLGWDTTYQPMDKVFPFDEFEGIKIHDWEG